MEGGMALLVGIVVGFYLSWLEALVCLACVPFMVIATVIGVKFQ